jgi:hypothetical protein
MTSAIQNTRNINMRKHNYYFAESKVIQFMQLQ